MNKYLKYFNPINNKHSELHELTQLNPPQQK